MVAYEKRGVFPELVGMKGINEHLCLPEGSDLDRILRYDTTVKRQMYQAMHELERLQRARKGEHVPAPVNVQVSSDG